MTGNYIITGSASKQYNIPGANTTIANTIGNRTYQQNKINKSYLNLGAAALIQTNENIKKLALMAK